MSLRRLTACCSHREHARPFVNEEGWVLTGDPDDSSTWESWFPDEWSSHCADYATERRRSEARRKRERYAA